MPFFEAKKIYSRCQGNAVYNFYRSADDQLVAELVRDGVAQRLPVAVPADFRTNLDEEKVSKLTMMFEQSYFTVTRGELTVNARGLGGWGDDTHKGYSRKFFMGKRMANKPRKGEGTYTWALSCGFTEKFAVIIADADCAVDGSFFGLFGHTGPAPLFAGNRGDAYDKQSWHFNTAAITDYSQHQLNGTLGDTRIQHAIANLYYAVCTERNIEVSLRFLGRGLHPLQDVFAHTSDFVTVPQDSRAIHLWAHVLDQTKGARADDPTYVTSGDVSKSPITVIPEDGVDEARFSQRYSDTKTVSLIYLVVYASSIKLKLPGNIIGDIVKRLEMKQPSIDQFDLGVFLQELKKKGLEVPSSIFSACVPSVFHDESSSCAAASASGSKGESSVSSSSAVDERSSDSDDFIYQESILQSFQLRMEDLERQVGRHLDGRVSSSISGGSEATSAPAPSPSSV